MQIRHATGFGEQIKKRLVIKGGNRFKRHKGISSFGIRALASRESDPTNPSSVFQSFLSPAPSAVLHRSYEQILDFLPCPRRFPQKFQTRLHRGIARETPDTNPISQHFPTINLHQTRHDGFERVAVERVVGVGIHPSWLLVRSDARPSDDTISGS